MIRKFYGKKKQNEANLAKDSEMLSSKIESLELALVQCQERERRALADYQNLVRQTQNQRANLIKLANADLLLSILESIEHLSVASEQLKDPGLELTIKELWQRLNAMGLEEIKVLNKKFDVDLMEVVEKTGDKEKVIKVLRKGYRLNGQVIQHAKVVLA